MKIYGSVKRKRNLSCGPVLRIQCRFVWVMKLKCHSYDLCLTSGNRSTLQYFIPFLNLKMWKHIHTLRLVNNKQSKRTSHLQLTSVQWNFCQSMHKQSTGRTWILPKRQSGAYFLHLSQLYMLSPAENTREIISEMIWACNTHAVSEISMLHHSVSHDDLYFFEWLHNS